MKYYHSKIEDISAVEVLSIFDDLCRAVDWPLGEQYNLVAWKWLVMFFQHWRGSQVTQKNVPYECPLTTRITKLVDKEVRVFCRELCEERRQGLELHETKTVLTLLKKLYDSPSMRLKSAKPLPHLHLCR